MKIWVDGDGCPTPIKTILFKAAERTQVTLTLGANRAVTIPRSAYLHFLRVPSGFDGADKEIVTQLCSGDLVITGDIPAAQVIGKGGQALGFRGNSLLLTPSLQGYRCGTSLILCAPAG